MTAHVSSALRTTRLRSQFVDKHEGHGGSVTYARNFGGEIVTLWCSCGGMWPDEVDVFLPRPSGPVPQPDDLEPDVPTMNLLEGGGSRWANREPGRLHGGRYVPGRLSWEPRPWARRLRRSLYPRRLWDRYLRRAVDRYAATR